MSSNIKTTENNEEEKKMGLFDFKTKLNWSYLIFTVAIHVAGLYGFITFPYISSKMTFFWCLFVANVAKFGETAGVHRLWSHRAYKAKWPLRLILLICYCTNGVLSPIEWINYHRVHHKYTDTDADPYNAKRGFFFSHLGWLCLKRHRQVHIQISRLDTSDLKADPILTYGERFYYPIMLMCSFIIPAIVPVYFWNESWYTSWLAVSMRYILEGNITATVNSVGHVYGIRPYDRNISPVENKTIAILTLGEGWHNYHHMFPWDYKAAELPIYSVNVTTFFIDMFAKIGWAYDLKQPSPELIKATCLKKGDGSHKIWGEGVPPPTN